ncbi:MAG: alpha/beta hydrolase [Planctomycetota bacterium]
MKTSTVLRLALLFAGAAAPPASALAAKEKITYPSIDGLRITADLYLAREDPATPFIVLFHQAGYSRGEYLEIAPRLNALGFNCLAVDQRSGSTVNEVANETVERAVRGGLGTTYVDALPDVVASLRFARERYAKGKLIAWGSSYSASLALKVAGDDPKLVDGVLAFSPGEYFERLGQPADWIRIAAKKVEQPVFVTSAADEKEKWAAIFALIPAKTKVSFLPETKGRHGASALWAVQEDSAAYWKAVESFLRAQFLPPGPPAAKESDGRNI